MASIAGIAFEPMRAFRIDGGYGYAGSGGP